MQITVRLLGSLRRHLPPHSDAQGRFEVDVPPGATVGEALAALSLGSGAPCAFLVNGLHGELDHPVQGGDELTVFPAVGGG